MIVMFIVLSYLSFALPIRAMASSYLTNIPKLSTIHRIDGIKLFVVWVIAIASYILINEANSSN